MKELIEKANSYAENNVNEVLKEAFAKVYSDGYRDGYNDCKEEISVDLYCNETQFVDLGLPSGTLWSTDYEKEGSEILYLPHYKANVLGIPTEEQWNELIENCALHYFYEGGIVKGFSCVGPNGNELVFFKTGYIIPQKRNEINDVYFWLMDNEGKKKKDQTCADIWSQNGIRYRTFIMFCGYKLPVRLVKNI